MLNVSGVSVLLVTVTESERGTPGTSSGWKYGRASWPGTVVGKIDQWPLSAARADGTAPTSAIETMMPSSAAVRRSPCRLLIILCMFCLPTFDDVQKGAVLLRVPPPSTVRTLMD